MGTENGSSITWYQFVSVVLPLCLSILVGAFLLNQYSENRLDRRIDRNMRLMVDIQADLLEIKLSIADLRAVLKERGGNGEQ